MNKSDTRGLMALAIVFAVAIGIALLQGQGSRPWRPTTAEVTGFGGASGRRGSVDVYLKNDTGYGVIHNVRPDQLNCRVGQKVAVEQSGGTLRGLAGACRRAPIFPGQPL